MAYTFAGKMSHTQYTTTLRRCDVLAWATLARVCCAVDFPRGVCIVLGGTASYNLRNNN